MIRNSHDEKRRNADKRAAFRQQLKIVAVRGAEMLFQIDRLIEERRDTISIQAGADDRKLAGDPPRVAPDSGTIPE